MSLISILKIRNSFIASKLISISKDSTIKRVDSSNDIINKINVIETSIVDKVNTRSF